MQIKKTRFLTLLSIMLVICATVAHAATEDFFRLCTYGTAGEVEAAIKNGADVNARDNKGASAIMVVGYVAPNPFPVMKVLIDNGADLNMQSEDGMTALMYAAIAMQNQKPEEAIALLLDSGANPNLKNARGETALDIAIKMGRYKGTEILKRLESVTSAKPN